MSAKVRVFTHNDLAVLNVWREKRGLAPLTMQILPFRGFIAPDLAAGFMYVADMKLAILEFFITNPEAPLKSRYFALDSIVNSLLDQAKTIGCMHVKCDTTINSIKRHYKDYDFKELGNYTVVMKEL